MSGKSESVDLDAQFDSPGFRIADDPTPLRDEASLQQDPGDVARDADASILERVQALQEWGLRDNDAAAAYVLAELETGDLPPDWRNALIFLAEDLRFNKEASQLRLCNRLKEFALELQDANEPDVERVVWSALRRFASLVPKERANELVEFLSHRGRVDTRLVAMQGVVHLFEPAPPESLEAVRPLADRIYELTMKLLDPDVVTSGETSAVAEQGVHALAALGDPRLEDCLNRVDSLQWAWLSRQVNTNLAELKSGWDGGKEGRESHPARLQVARVLESREPSRHEQVSC